MNLDFLSGLLLITVVLATVVFVAKEILDNRHFNDRSSIREFLRFLPRVSRQEAEPVNNHLIGLIGEVISHSGDSSRPMMVRIHPELWPARQESTAEAPLPVGSVVKVAAVDGSVLVVEASTSLGESPNAS